MLFYRLVRSTFRVLAAPMFRFRVEGRERVPPSGPGVVVAAHRSWLDPACVAAACPRPIRFLVLDSVYQRGRARWFFRRMHSVPIKPGGIESIAALRTALRLLGSGELIGVFPEGRVFGHGTFGPVHPGAAMLAVRAQAPVIPVVIRGSARAWPHGQRFPRPAPVFVRIGEPIPPPSTVGREAIDELRDRIEGRLRRLALEADA